MAGEQSAYTATGNPILITDTYMSDIADAIRTKTGSVDTYTPAQMATAISAIETGGSSAFNALTPSQQENFRSTVGITTDGKMSLNIASLTNFLQIRYIVFHDIVNYQTCIYSREAWISYGSKEEYANWACVPLIHLLQSASSGITLVGLSSSYLYPSTTAHAPFRCLDKRVITNNDLTNIYLYQMGTGGLSLGNKITNNQRYFIMWDTIENMPTE